MLKYRCGVWIRPYTWSLSEALAHPWEWVSSFTRREKLLSSYSYTRTHKHTQCLASPYLINVVQGSLACSCHVPLLDLDQQVSHLTLSQAWKKTRVCVQNDNKIYIILDQHVSHFTLSEAWKKPLVCVCVCKIRTKYILSLISMYCTSRWVRPGKDKRCHNHLVHAFYYKWSSNLKVCVHLVSIEWLASLCVLLDATTFWTQALTNIANMGKRTQ